MEVLKALAIRVSLLMLFISISAQGSIQLISNTEVTRRSSKEILSGENESTDVLPVKMNNNAPIKGNKLTFFEDFQQGIPGDWTLINADGLTPNGNVSYVNQAWVARVNFDSTAVEDTVAISTSWYDPVGQADDWLITPQLNIGEDDILRWEAKAQDPSYPDGYEVRISTTTPTVEAFMANDPLFSIPAEQSSWIYRSINLADLGYASMPVYIAFRNHSYDKFLLMIDDVEIFEDSGESDGAISSVVYPSEFSSIPLVNCSSLSLGGTVQNAGFVTLTNVHLNVNVFKDGTLIDNFSSEAISELATGTEQSVELSPYTAASTGEYVFKYYISSDAEEANTENDTLETSLSITEHLITRHIGPVTSALSIGAGTTGELGQTITLMTDVYIDSIKIYLINTDNGMTGYPVHALIRNFTIEPGEILATTDTITVPFEGPQWITLPVRGSFQATPATYFVGIEEGDPALTLGYSSEIYTAGATWVNFPGSPFGGWANSEDYGFSPAYSIETYFTEIPNSINNGEQLPQEFSLQQNFPNPFNPSTAIPFFLDQPGMVTLEIYNIMGQKLQILIQKQLASGYYEYNFNASNLTSGIYIYRLTTPSGIKQMKMTLIK